MREPLQPPRGDPYERPNQAWLCGLADDGAPCPMGPDARGQCPAETACHPLRDGDRWRCNRSALRGGPCEDGPSPEGACCLVYQCTPMRSLRARRGRFVATCLLATLGSLCLLLSGDWRNAALSPGELSLPHAQLTQRGEPTERCGSCHAAADQSLGQWLQHGTRAAAIEPSQTELCLKCHEKQIPRALATAAHNVELTQLLSLGDDRQDRGEALLALAGERRRDPAEPLACAACHREHRGPNHDLTRMSDRACQACHKQFYHSFAIDHPEFDHWPTVRRTRIAFDHGLHQHKHFPEQKKEFACAACHRPDDAGAFQQTLDYAESCVECHESKIQTSWETGVTMFALPTIDVETLRQAGHDVGQWPAQAVGDFDGALPVVTKLLLVADERGAAALAALGADFDFFDVDPDDPRQLQATAEVVGATKRLLFEMTQRGQAAVRRRMEKVLGRELSAEELTALVARLSPDTWNAISERWLRSLPQEFSDGAENRPEQGATVSAAALPQQDRGEVLRQVVGGGWFRDEATLSIRYRPVGHADPWITAWTNVLAEAAAGPHADLAEPLLRQWLKPTAPGLCGSCHSVDRTAAGGLIVQWRPRLATDPQPAFTKFSHGPHLLQPQLADCTHCHAIDGNAKVMASYTGDDPRVFASDFLPLDKQSCAQCHTAGAAGDACLQCHRYHTRGVEQ